MTNSTTWQKTTPPAPGLYIASTSRNASYVRYWTGKYWTQPLHVADLYLTDRIPKAGDQPGHNFRGEPVQWLAPFALDPVQ